MRDLSDGMNRLLDRLAESDEVAAIDLALARMLAEHDRGHAEAVALGAALVSMLQRSGHSAVRVGPEVDGEATWAGRDVPGTTLALPDAEAWTAALAASPVVGEPGDEETRPLVLDDGRLSLYRLWAAERRVAAALTARLGASELDVEALRPTFQALFPDAADGDRQALAAAGALRHRLAVVAGGPGTGKTTTVAKLLALLLTANPELDIALATPTGKASDRLGRSVAEKVADLAAAGGFGGS